MLNLIGVPKASREHPPHEFIIRKHGKPCRAWGNTGTPSFQTLPATLGVVFFLIAMLLGSAFIHFYKVTCVVVTAAIAGATVCAMIGAKLLELPGRRYWITGIYCLSSYSRV